MRAVVQCRQDPKSFSPKGETVGWNKKWNNAAISKHFSNDSIERFTHSRGSIIPYRVLVSLDVTTREDEQQQFATEIARLKKRVAKTEKTLQKDREALAQVCLLYKSFFTSMLQDST